MKEELDSVSLQWIAGKVRDVSEKRVAWILVQEPNFVGFCVVTDSHLHCPPVLLEPDWGRVEDIRLFGEFGEWHVWKTNLQTPRWRARYWGKSDLDRGWVRQLLALVRRVRFWGKKDLDTSKPAPETIDEYHVIWGTRIDGLQPCQGWWCYVEDRGTRIWLPFRREQEQLPLRLHVKQVIGFPSDDHIARIVDAVVCAITDAEKNEILLPAPSVFS